QVEQNARLGRMSEKQVVRQGLERGSLAAGRQIPRTEVADSGHPGTLRHDRRHADTQRGRKTSVRLMPRRVAAATDALHSLKPQTGPVRGLPRRGSECFPQKAMQKTQLRELGRLPRLSGTHKIAQLSRIWLLDHAYGRHL